MKKNSAKLPISIIILTDRNDRRFLASLKSAQIAQEILVIDNHSSNDWKRLAQDFSFRVEEYNQPVLNFAEVRNYAMEVAAFDWILFLDSDEILTEGAAKEISDILAMPDVAGALIIRKDIFLGKQLSFGEAGYMKLLRLFKKEAAHFNRAIHETAKVNGNTVDSGILILHYAHNTIGEFFDDISWYAENAARQEKLALPELILKLIIFPPAKFLHNFVIRLGFLDGWRGLIYAVIMSLHSFSVRVFIYEQSKKDRSTA